MIGRTLSFYLAGRFARTVIAAFSWWSFVLIYVGRSGGMLRRSGDAAARDRHPDGRPVVPANADVAEQALPFAVLFGSMIAFLNLSRKMELVVARAAGVSVWQILTPPLIVIVAIGIFSVAAYNPASTWMKQRSDADRNRACSAARSSARWGCGFGRRASTARRSSAPAARSADGTEFNRRRGFQLRRQGEFRRAAARRPRASCTTAIGCCTTPRS